MGVYIPNWEKPKSCDECWAEYAYEICNSHSDCCPLVPVPPHGRLGDLDSLALLVLKWISTQEKAYPHEDSNALAWRLGARAMGNQIYRDIMAYPTIIPASGGNEDE